MTAWYPVDSLMHQPHCTTKLVDRKHNTITNTITDAIRTQKANAEGEEVGIEPRRDISFCSFQMANTDEEDDEDRYALASPAEANAAR